MSETSTAQKGRAAFNLRHLRRDNCGGDGQVLWSGVIVLCPSGWVMR